MTSPITKHLNNRINLRYKLVTNRKARIELINWIRKGKATKLFMSEQPKNRIVLSVPVFLSPTLCALNPKIQFGDRVIVVYDTKLNRIITALNNSYPTKVNQK